MTSARYDIIFMEVKKYFILVALVLLKDLEAMFSNCKNQSVLKSQFIIDQASLQWYVLRKFVDSSTHLQLESL